MAVTITEYTSIHTHSAIAQIINLFVIKNIIPFCRNNNITLEKNFTVSGNYGNQVVHEYEFTSDQLTFQISVWQQPSSFSWTVSMEWYDMHLHAYQRGIGKNIDFVKTALTEDCNLCWEQFKMDLQELIDKCNTIKLT